jgi:purine-binding chemotaxis protein CheW
MFEMNDLNQYIVFLIDNRRFAIPIEMVERVIHAVEITLIPDSPYMMSGVINMEGTVISVIGIRRCLNITYREIQLNDRFVIVQGGGKKLALIVDSVSDMLSVSGEDIVEREELYEGLTLTKEAIRRDDGVIPVLDVDQLPVFGDEKIRDNETLHETVVT